jgi:integrase
MTQVRLKYLHSFTDRHGHVRFYFRYRGNRWPVPAPHEEGFATAYDALLTGIKSNPTRLAQNVAFMRGSLGWVIEQFIASPAYQTRADATKRNYRRVIDALKQRYGTGLMKDLQPRHVKLIRNDIREAFTTTAADIAIGIVSTLYDFADEQLGLDLGADPTFGIKRVHVGHHEHEPWPQDLIARFMAEASPRLAFAVRLALGTGLRRSDLVKLRWTDLRGDHFAVNQQKTGAPVLVGCGKELLAELETMPRIADTIIVGDRGHAVTAASLSRTVRLQLRDMGVTGYSIHGLRKNAGNEIAEAGGTEREIMVRLGHKTPQMAAHYTKRASQAVSMRSAVESVESGNHCADSTLSVPLIPAARNLGRSTYSASPLSFAAKARGIPV